MVPGHHREIERLAVGQWSESLSCPPWCFPLSRRRAAAPRSAEPCVVAVAAPADDVPQDRCLAARAARQRSLRLSCRCVSTKSLKHQVELEQAAPAFPLQPALRQRVHPSHRCASTINSLILPIALRRVEVLRADVDAVHDGMAAEQAVRVLEVVEALGGRLVARVGDEAVGLQQAGRADELVRVPPERRAGGRAAGAQDALVEAVQLLALLRRLQALALGRRDRG